MTTADNKNLEKIARLSLRGVTQENIGKVFQVSASHICQIQQLPEYKEIEQIIAVQIYEEQEIIAQGWDAVESKAVSRVLTYLNNVEDEDYALKAAVAANRAIRRGNPHQNSPINPQSTGVRAVVNLNPVFVEKVQQNFQINHEKRDSLINNKKDSNFLAPKAVQDLLSTDNAGNKLEFNANKPVTNPLTESIESDLQDLQIGTLVD